MKSRAKGIQSPVLKPRQKLVFFENEYQQRATKNFLTQLGLFIEAHWAQWMELDDFSLEHWWRLIGLAPTISTGIKMRERLLLTIDNADDFARVFQPLVSNPTKSYELALNKLKSAYVDQFLNMNPSEAWVNFFAGGIRDKDALAKISTYQMSQSCDSIVEANERQKRR